MDEETFEEILLFYFYDVHNEGRSEKKIKKWTILVRIIFKDNKQKIIYNSLI